MCTCMHVHTHEHRRGRPQMDRNNEKATLHPSVCRQKWNLDNKGMRIVIGYLGNEIYK